MQRALDATGLGLSALCLVHCLALPVAALSLPLAGQLAEAEWVHWLMVGLAAPTSLAAVWPRLRDRPFPWIIPLFAALG
ncbi:MAG: MerC domain-containing protein, partial [Terricaulis sp.]